MSYDLDASRAPWSRRRFLQSTLAASALATGLCACGSRKTDTVRLGWGAGGLPLLAKERGEFAKTLAADGIKVEWIGPFPNHAPSLQAVTGGSADFSFGGSTTPALAAMIAGSPLVFANFCVVDPRSTAIIARDGSGIERVEDLVGKSVAVNRSGLGEFLLVAALEKHNVDRNSVKLVYLNPPDAAPAFGQGKVDAWSMWSPGVDIARANYKGHDIFLEGRDLDFQIDFNSYVTTRKFAQDNPDLVRAVNKAYAQEAQWASEHPDEAERIAQKQGNYSDEVRATLTAMKRRYTMHGVDDKAFVQDLQKAADWLTKRNVLPQQITVADYLVKV
ncbi:NrtA/SsuA/CpmA family ABC transporter substrate-binding protein [Paraburkholderia sp. RL18-103-BIB-C]|jgi:sulfonate transport system substrate-binding protein|uniref:ABC transporter substrate-binding protein n=1 Tax=unclassified Paraburkholderia TaxID=2615204 RepID=UPI0038B9B0E6